MKHTVSELSGAMLDAAVALAEGHYLQRSDAFGLEIVDKRTSHLVQHTEYSVNWADGGPIIERERILLGQTSHGRGWIWEAQLVSPPEVHNLSMRAAWWGPTHEGETALIAAMRAYCASKLGDEVELP